MIVSCIIILLIITGCASIFEPLGSKNAAAGCQLADVASTHYALHHNPNAYEENSIPVPVLNVIKLALASYIKWGVSDEDWDNSWIGVRVFVTAIGCGAAINNIHVAREKP